MLNDHRTARADRAEARSGEKIDHRRRNKFESDGTGIAQGLLKYTATRIKMRVMTVTPNTHQPLSKAVMTAIAEAWVDQTDAQLVALGNEIAQSIDDRRFSEAQLRRLGSLWTEELGAALSGLAGRSGWTLRPHTSPPLAPL
jgi:hypothetical protein